MNNNLGQEQSLASAEDDADEEAVLRKYVKDLAVAGEFWVGKIDDEAALESLERELMTLGVSFKTQASYRNATDNSGRWFFSMDQGVVPIHLDMPFRVVSKIIKGCLFGRDRHKTVARRAEALANGVDESLHKKKTKPYGTKKIGCTAKLHLKVIDTYPDFTVQCEGVPLYQFKISKAAAVSCLTRALSSGQEVRCQRLIYLAMSRRSCHSGHGFDDLLNKKVRRKRRSSSTPLSLTQAREFLEESVDKVKAMCTQCTDVEKIEAATGLLVEAQKLLAEGTPASTCEDLQNSPTNEQFSGKGKGQPAGCARLCPLSPVEKQVPESIASGGEVTILLQSLTS